MGKVRKAEKAKPVREVFSNGTNGVKLVAGLISNDTGLFDRIKSILEKRLHNTVDFESPLLDFNHTDYYNEEFGFNLKRKFLSFKAHVPLENIEKVKLLTNRVEHKTSTHGKRTINIDPGYLDLSKLVLFSTKDYSHRIYVSKGIFAEVTLRYKNKQFNPWPWTYPDYSTKEYISVFDSIREIYKKQIAGKS
jgi:hypothetical protein